MSELDREHRDELEEMIRHRKKGEPVEKVLAVFCHRHGTSIEKCTEYYEQLKDQGKISE